MSSGRVRPEELALAEAAARGAGRIVRSLFRADLPVRFKARDQPVTEADLTADRHLRACLAPPGSAYGWISEESEEGAVEGERVWVVDPLDGTVHFVAGRPEFSVCVGLLDRGTPVLGVVYNPMADRLYRATLDGAAQRDEASIRSRPFPDARPVLVASHTDRRAGLLDGFVGWEIAAAGGTALKMMRVAEGVADVYVAGGRKGIWDVCAGMVIATAAGARVLQMDGSPIDFSLGARETDGLLVVGRGGEQRISEVTQLVTAGGARRKTGGKT